MKEDFALTCTKGREKIEFYQEGDGLTMTPCKCGRDIGPDIRQAQFDAVVKSLKRLNLKVSK